MAISKNKIILLIIGLACCTFFCCCGGIFASLIFGPTRSKDGLAANSSSPEKTLSEKEPPLKSSSRDETTTLYAGRTERYERELLEWNQLNDSKVGIDAERIEIEAKIRTHEMDKPIPPAENQSRIWTSTDKKFTTDGILIDTDYQIATIKKSDGKTVKISKDRFIDVDRAYIESSFVDAKVYRQNLAKWEVALKTLEDERMSIQDRLSAVDKPKPMLPSKTEFAKELESIKAKEKEQQQIAQAEEARKTAERKLEETRVASERKAREAEAKKQEESMKAASARKQAQDEVDAYAAIIGIVDPQRSLITKVSAIEDTLTLTVANSWHYQPYQIRLQAAQSLWEGWAKIHVAKDVDRCRLKLVDNKGNEVGGSRILAGSFIWVQKD